MFFLLYHILYNACSQLIFFFPAKSDFFLLTVIHFFIIYWVHHIMWKIFEGLLIWKSDTVYETVCIYMFSYTCSFIWGGERAVLPVHKHLHLHQYIRLNHRAQTMSRPVWLELEIYERTEGICSNFFFVNLFRSLTLFFTI